MGSNAHQNGWRHAVGRVASAGGKPSAGMERHPAPPRRSAPLLAGLPDSPPACRLSAVIIAHNEEDRLGDCLRSLRDVADEILLVDDHSTDRTGEIAWFHGARILTRRFDRAARQMNFGIEAARGEWILIIDADERLSPALAEEIAAVLSRPAAHAAYDFPRQNVVFGRFLRYGGNYPDYNSARLFLRGRAWFEDQPVHARLIVEGSTGRLRGDLLHLTAPDLHHYLAKFNAYTSLEAERMESGGVRYSLTRMMLHSLAHLGYRLIVQCAFLDGAAGLQYVFLGFLYDIIRYLKLRERQRRRPQAASAAATSAQPMGNGAPYAYRR